MKRQLTEREIEEAAHYPENQWERNQHLPCPWCGKLHLTRNDAVGCFYLCREKLKMDNLAEGCDPAYLIVSCGNASWRKFEMMADYINYPALFADRLFDGWYRTCDGKIWR